MKNLLTKSNEMSTEYCISVVRLGEILPIENADSIAKTLVNGREIVISKDKKEGDIMLYASNECQLNFDFMHVNNLFQDYTLNANADEVAKWLEENADATEEEKTLYRQKHSGYFDKKCRVRMKKLRGTLSMGFLFEPALVEKWCPMLDVNWEELVGEDFDTVNDVLLVKAYVPETPERRVGGGRDAKLARKLKSFDRMIPGQFSFHYETQQLNKEIYRISPTDVVTISCKLHGTSAIIGRILVKQPRWCGWFGWYESIFPRLPKFLQFTVPVYDLVRSSRKVIINKTINPKKGIGYSGGQVQEAITAWAERIGAYIPEGVTIYGEITGYYEGSNKPIQIVGGSVYDYKSKIGENSLMIYRVKQVLEDGTVKEYDVQEVYDWTLDLISKIQADEARGVISVNEEETKISDRIHPIDILYHGTLADLYPELDVENHWHENVLEKLKNDTEHFGMELQEPLCRNKCYREGIVLRKDADVIPEAWKLKTLRFLQKEADDMDKGKISDEEMMERYS